MFFVLSYRYSCFLLTLIFSPQPLYDSTKKGDPVLIDDGNVVLEVTGHVGDGHGVKCRALNSGKIKNRRGVNVPNSKVRRCGVGGWMSYASLSVESSQHAHLPTLCSLGGPPCSHDQRPG